MDNYEFCAAWAAQFGAVLDFGCGAGKTVQALRDKGLDAWGFDIRLRDSTAPEIRPFIKITDGSLPFDSERFDAVISNFVFEHVQNLDASLKEIARVLKPGGKLLALFPTRGVLIEGHVMLPAVHWFGRSRPYIAAAMRLTGIGADWPGSELMAYGREVDRYISTRTCYRTRAEVLSLINRHFAKVEHIECDWTRSRASSSRVHRLLSRLPSAVQPLAIRSLLGSAMVLTNRVRPHAAHHVHGVRA